MDYDFSIIKNPAYNTPVALKTVYAIYGDRSYDVHREPLTVRNLIALRTHSGLGRISLANREELALTPGTLLLCKYPDVRSYSCVGEKWDFFWFEFSCADVGRFPVDRLLQVDPVDNELADCQACLELLRKNELRAAVLASATLNTLLHKWLLHYDGEEDTNPHRIAVQKVIEYITSQLDGDLSIKKMAGIAGLCERRFRQVFTEITGTQPKKYVEEVKIRLAEELLRNTPISIEDISVKLGYSSPFHFCTAFRRHHGMPPSRFRRSPG